MTSYSGFFVRDQLGDLPSNPKSPGWSGSPDIILAGTALCPDPNSYTTTTGYSQDYGSQLFISQTNYTYLRALNATGGAFSGRLWFYYTESDLALWPQNWKSEGIWNGGAQQNWADIGAQTSQQVAVTPPFQWVPAPLQGSAGDHYCLVCWAENQPVSSPPVDPKPTTSMGSWSDLANFVISTPNMGWRNTVMVAGKGTTWSYIAPITGPTGPDGGSSLINVGFQCNNMPTNGSLSVSMPGPPGQDSINIINQPINTANMSMTVKYDNWPNNFNTQMTIQFFQGATTPQPNSGIVPVLTMPANDLLNALAAKTGHPVHIMDLYEFAPSSVKGHGHKRILVNRGPVPTYIIGGTPLVY